MTTIVREIEESIKAAKVYVDQAAALERLTQNRDFKAVILEGYLEKEAVRLVHLKAHPAMSAPERQTSILQAIDSVGGLLTYFRAIEQQAASAQKSIEQDEATMAEVLTEGSDE